VIAVDGIELLRRLVDVCSELVVDWIGRQSPKKFQPMGVLKLFIQPVVILDVFRFAIEYQPLALVHAEIGRFTRA